MAGMAPPRWARLCPDEPLTAAGAGNHRIPSGAAGGTVRTGPLPCNGLDTASRAVQCRRFWPQPPADVAKLMTQVAHQKLRNGELINRTETSNAFALSGGPCFFSASAVNSGGSYLGTSPWLRTYPVWRYVRGRSYSCSSVLSTREKLYWWKLI